MLYQIYESMQFTTAPFRLSSKLTRQYIEHPANPWGDSLFGRHLASSLKFFEFMTEPNSKPEFGIDHIDAGEARLPVSNKVHIETPFCELRRFRAEGATELSDKTRLPVLVVAPMSGHHATLLRDTVKRLLVECDVFITDWVDVRDIALEEGTFDLESYIAHIRDFITALMQQYGSLHVVAVCQPGPAVLSAVALLANDKSKNTPSSMTFMGSPIDPRRSPTVPNEFAQNHSLAWFNNHMICTVPMTFEGAGRRVYPGFLQLTGFINMNPLRHQNAWQQYYNNLVSGDMEAIEAHEYFYSEYNAVMDMSADFYLQTIDRVFHKAAIATGEMTFRHRKVDPAAITDTALMTIEGEKDDISGVGQTQAAHDICSGLPASRRRHLLQHGAGHYGVFSGRRWRNEIAPELLEFMREHHPADMEKSTNY